MECPNCNHQLEIVLFHDVEVDHCPECLGVFFDKNELLYAKNDKDEQLTWVDFDIWRDKKKFELLPSNRRCPECRIPFVLVNYDNSNVKIDFCKNCQGVWLDRGEFKQIVVYLKKKADYEILHHYTKNLVTELWEVFAGPEKLREELVDFLMVIKLLKYKFVAQHPYIESAIESLPK